MRRHTHFLVTLLILSGFVFSLPRSALAADGAFGLISSAVARGPAPSQPTAAVSAIARGPATSQSATPVAARKVALHISFLDNTAFTQSSMDETDEFIRATLPDLKLISVKTVLPRLFARTLRARLEIQKQIRAQLAPDDLITHLILDTHGNTLKDENDETELITTLAHVGHVSSKAGDKDFRSFFKFLKGRLAPDATVVLNSCSTLCGPEEPASARAKMLLKELGIPNGQIYGAVVNEVDVPGALVRKGSLIRSFTDWRQFKLYAVVSSALSIPLAISASPDNHLHAAEIAVLGTAGFATTIQLAIPFVKKAIARIQDVNRGRLLIFKNGKIVSNVEVKKYDDKLEIYGANCSAALLGDSL
jgi:hypothetical protein